jgi:hypothetical protein
MQTIDLSPVQNQTFTSTLDGDFYDIDIFLAAGIMACNITRNNIVICSGQRIVGGSFLIPFFAYEGSSGNFMLLTTQTDGQFEIPFYTQFGLTQTLVYISWQEIATIVGGTVP